MRIAMGIPVVDSVPGEALRELIQQGIEVSKVAEDILFLSPFNFAPHDRARNVIMTEALKEGCDYLYFIDDDMVIPPGAFQKLFVELRDRNAVLVSGHYLRRGWPYHCVWSKKIGDVYKPVDASEGVHEIDTSGLGCALVDLHWVRDHLQSPWFEMGQDELGTIVMDDVTFMTKIREKGGLILGHGGVRCGHLAQRAVVCDATARQLRQFHMATEVSNGSDSELRGEQEGGALEDSSADGHEGLQSEAAFYE